MNTQQSIRQFGAALGVSAFVSAATAGGFRVGLPRRRSQFERSAGIDIE